MSIVWERVFCDADAVGEGDNLGDRPPTQGERDVLAHVLAVGICPPRPSILSFKSIDQIERQGRGEQEETRLVAEGGKLRARAGEVELGDL